MERRPQMDAKPTLPPLGTRRLQQAICFPLTAYCDIHDLLAVVLDDGNVDVFRIANSQVAFTVKRKDDECEVKALHWKPDGSYLAIAWSDGTYVLHSGENGRLTSQANIRAADRQDDWRLDLKPDFGPDDDETNVTSVTCFGWSIQDGRRAGEETLKPTPTTDDWHDGTWTGEDDATEKSSRSRSWLKESIQPTIADLTRSITTLDVTRVLPRLSAIPAHQMPLSKAGPGGNKFASQAATDAIFQVSKDVHSHSVQSLFVCQDDGDIQVLMDETVKIGSCHTQGRPLFHLSHPNNPTHVILSEINSTDISLHSINLPLSTLSGPFLHVISTNTKRIQSLIDYIAHSVRCIEHDFTTGQQLPGRLLNNLNETLSEKDEGSAVYNLCHLAMTGDFSPTMLEWLVDIVKETNHKRWDQAVGTMYTNIHNHVFMNLLPAIDRLSIAITTLRGHAKHREGTGEFDVPPDMFTDMLDAVDSMRLVAQKVQLIIMTEHKQFRAFSKWLRIYIDIGIAEPFSRSAIEIEERELPSLDYSLVMAYVNDTMTGSKLSPYIHPRPGMSGGLNQADFFQNSIINSISYERSLAALKLLNDNKPLEIEGVADPASLLNLPSITVILLGRARVVLERITKWQSRMLPSPISLPVPISGQDIADAVATPTGSLLLILPTESSTQSFSTVTVNPSAKLPVFSAISLGFQDHDSQILDAGFDYLNPPAILVLVQQADHTNLLKHTLDSGVTERPHVFEQSNFKPEKLLVGGRRGKRVCVVFGNGGREWRAYALGSADALKDGKKADTKRKGLQSVDEEWEDEDMMMGDGGGGDDDSDDDGYTLT